MSIFLTHRRIVKDSVKKSIKKYLAIHPTAEAAGFLAGFYNQFLNADGEADCKIAASVVNLYYITPKGKKEKIDRNYFIQILEYDKIIYGDSGYKLSASHKSYGRTHLTEKNGYLRNKVLFNSKGIDYLVKKYKDDKRIWRAIDGQLYCEEA